MIRSLVSSKDLTRNTVEEILDLAHQFKNGFVSDILTNTLVGVYFFEASTRTKLSFQAAISSLRGNCIGFDDVSNISLSQKNESLLDTLKIITSYVDIAIIRHKYDGICRLAQEIIDIPIINAGDGSNEHPTQALIDVFSMFETQDMKSNISIALMGDLFYSRTIHSLLYMLSLFDVRLYFVTPHKQLMLSEQHLFHLKKSGISYSFHNKLADVIEYIDCLYVTRLQKERIDSTELKNLDYTLTLDMLSANKPGLRIFHPLPRNNELSREIDNTQFAYYFQQAKNAVFVRQAVLHYLYQHNRN